MILNPQRNTIQRFSLNVLLSVGIPSKQGGFLPKHLIFQCRQIASSSRSQLNCRFFVDDATSLCRHERRSPVLGSCIDVLPCPSDSRPRLRKSVPRELSSRRAVAHHSCQQGY